MKKILTLPILILIGICLYDSVYIIPEGYQAVVKNFGNPLYFKTEKGLQFKKPFINQVTYLPTKILSWDGEPKENTTKDKKFIFVDVTARWKIVDPIVMLQKVTDEERAYRRISSSVNGKTKDVVSKYNLVESVRNSNDILQKVEEIKNSGNDTEEVFGDIETIEKGREALSDEIKQLAEQELKELGIELVDVQLKRIAYTGIVEDGVHNRMISERKRIAQNIRAIGKEREEEIKGRMEKELQTIKSDAYKQVQEILGTAEATTTKIYADSFGQDKQFYDFIKSMEVYEEVMKDKSNFILSTDHPFLKNLKQ